MTSSSAPARPTPALRRLCCASLNDFAFAALCRNASCFSGSGKMRASQLPHVSGARSSRLARSAAPLQPACRGAAAPRRHAFRCSVSVSTAEAPTADGAPGRAAAVQAAKTAVLRLVDGTCRGMSASRATRVAVQEATLALEAFGTALDTSGTPSFASTHTRSRTHAPPPCAQCWRASGGWYTQRQRTCWCCLKPRSAASAC